MKLKYISTAIFMVTTASLAISVPASAGTYKTHGYCGFGNSVFHPEFKSAYIEYEGSLADFRVKKQDYMAEFEKSLRSQFDIDETYKGVKVVCYWYPRSRETPEKVKELRMLTMESGNEYDTDWVPGNTSIKAKFIPKKKY